jgi:hypothetical protein
LVAFGDLAARRETTRRVVIRALVPVVGGELDRGLASAPIPIVEAVLRHPIVVAGRIVDAAVVEQRGCRSLAARLEDGTGALELVFLGRPRLWGVEIGRLLSADGVVGRDRGRLRMLNPLITLYEREDGEC